MILFTGLSIALLVCAVVAALFAVVGGGAFILVFGDVIVFGLLVMLLIKIFGKKKSS